MPLSVTLSTTLRKHVAGYQPEHGLSLSADGLSTVLELAQSLKLPLADIKITMLNGRRVELNTKLHDGDRVAFFPAVGGG